MNKILLLSLFLLISCGKEANKNNNSEAKIISSGIINGESVEDGESLEQSTVSVGNCTGTIISEDLVITAAHCVSMADHYLFSKTKIIKHYSSMVNFRRPKSSIMSYDIIIHPDYKANKHDDLALVKLKSKIPAGTYKPVAILDPAYKLDQNSELIIAGYGLQCGKCDSKSTRSELLQKRKQSFLKYYDKNLLIKQENGVEGAYYGDSGGPAFLETQTELLLVGSTRGPGPREKNVQYINLSEYKDFILESAKKMGATLPVFKMPNE